MGNTATIICGVRPEKELITVLQANGKVLEFSQKVRAAELIVGHPHHFLCNASAILSGERGKMLPPRAVLQRGKIYLLLPLPGARHSSTKGSSSSSEGDELQQANTMCDNARSAVARRTTKFVISKQYLDKILLHNDGKVKELNRGPAAAPKQTITVKRRSTMSWAPALESIPEVAAR
ncbi:hypothetical protein O6H91_14G024700 [Diphasiastrum complanatum]|uniref:Uncharacterized protein n=1 Tax=Diphasiastrum complanatum TaxID=34168 RepID=A0ACC2BN41_DIPCM|nr:hypothetical protein O6H91_14G024700 [Diphasiastrum complanatum]